MENLQQLQDHWTEDSRTFARETLQFSARTLQAGKMEPATGHTEEQWLRDKKAKSEEESAPVLKC